MGACHLTICWGSTFIHLYKYKGINLKLESGAYYILYRERERDGWFISFRGIFPTKSRSERKVVLNSGITPHDLSAFYSQLFDHPKVEPQFRQ